MMILSRIKVAAASHGLIVRGGFHPIPEDGVPQLSSGARVQTLVLIGNAGPEMWRNFVLARMIEPEIESAREPLDTWNAAALRTLADGFGAEPFSPFVGPPYLPFQRWAQRAESVHPSPIGMLIHPDYGLWHGYRGALAFGSRLALPMRAARASPCESCADKPCLGACPVNAFTAAGFDVDACVGHVKNRQGEKCLRFACQARHACPVGREYTYAPAQAEFHMRGFLDD